VGREKAEERRRRREKREKRGAKRMGGKKVGVMRERDRGARESGWKQRRWLPSETRECGWEKRESVGGEGADGKGKYGQEERRWREPKRGRQWEDQESVYLGQ
jgi:hypothetical protein